MFGNKKGAETSTALVYLIIAAVLLVLVIIWLTGGFKGVTQKTDALVPSVLQTHIEGCKTACGIATNDYCIKQRTVKQKDLTVEIQKELTDAPVSATANADTKDISFTCSQLQKWSKAGLECSLTC